MWPNAKRFLAVNPLVPTPHRELARAAEHLGERDQALTAYRAVAMLDDTDPAEVHYRLAKLLRHAGKPQEPAARFSVHWKKRLDSARHISSCWSWSNRSLRRRLLHPRQTLPRR